MKFHLENKVALVTGSTAGIGFAIAKLLIQEGATVAINGRSQQRVDSAIQKISVEHPNAKLISVPGDLGTAQGGAEVTKKLPIADILVNNMGIAWPKPFNEITDEDWLNIFNVNVMSGVRLSRHYLPQMLKQNWGRIVFISSESGVQIPTEMIDYGMTKAAQLAISRGLAQTTSGTAVTVNTVLPGPTHTEIVDKFLKRIAEEKNISMEEAKTWLLTNLRPTQLLKRFTTSEEVANLVVFICSPLSAATNGAALRADGGTVNTMV